MAEILIDSELLQSLIEHCDDALSEWKRGTSKNNDRDLAEIEQDVRVSRLVMKQRASNDE